MLKEFKVFQANSEFLIFFNDHACWGLGIKLYVEKPNFKLGWCSEIFMVSALKWKAENKTQKEISDLEK